MTPSLDVDRQARRALTRQTSGAIASTLTRGNRLITPNIAEGISGLSQREMRRRAEQGRFPEPVKIGEGKNGRIAYVEAEVLEWVAARIEERDRKAAAGGESETQPQHEFEADYPSAAATQALAERSTAQQRRGAVARPSRSREGRRRS
jgi:predicted DNA-binding transcriptional regulator AlpA